MIVTVGNITKEVLRRPVEDMILQLIRGDELAAKKDYVESIRELKDLKRDIGYEIDKLEVRGIK